MSTDYHDRPGVSSTMLRCFLRSRREYEARYVLGTMDGEATDAMEFGTAGHALLEGRSVDDVAMVIPAEVLASNGARSGGKWKEFVAANADKTLLKQPDMDRLLAVERAVRRHPLASLVLRATGECEAEYEWLDGPTELTLRAKLDKRCDLATPIIADFKIVADPSPSCFAKAAHDRGYHIQQAVYQAALRANGIEADMVFIVVGSQPPHVCRAYRLDLDAELLGVRDMGRALIGVANCTATGNWAEPDEDKLTEISFPKWAFTER